MTKKDRIIIRGYLNDFSDRWPEEYRKTYNQFIDRPIQFETAILWEMLNIELSVEESMEIWHLLDVLRDFLGEKRIEVEPPKRQKTKVVIDDISTGDL